MTADLEDSSTTSTPRLVTAEQESWMEAFVQPASRDMPRDVCISP